MILEEKLRKLETTKEYARSQEQETSLSPDEKTALPENIPPETPKQLVEHPKYGRGSIISETEDTIVIQFDDYGEKEMLKAFSQLKKIPNNIPV